MLPFTHFPLQSPCPPNRMRANLSTSVPPPFAGGCQFVFRTNLPKPSTCHHRGHSRSQPTAWGHWCDNTMALHIGDWALDHTASSSFSNQEPLASNTNSSEPTTRVPRILIPMQFHIGTQMQFNILVFPAYNPMPMWANSNHTREQPGFDTSWSPSKHAKRN